MHTDKMKKEKRLGMILIFFFFQMKLMLLYMCYYLSNINNDLDSTKLLT